MKYTELEVWKEATSLVSCIYSVIKEFPSNERFGLTSQIQRSVISIPSNIAEGCGRQHVNDSIRFFFIARGSLYELETQIYLAMDLSYINEKDFERINIKLKKCRKLLSGFINYFERRSSNELSEPKTLYQQQATENRKLNLKWKL